MLWLFVDIDMMVALMKTKMINMILTDDNLDQRK